MMAGRPQVEIDAVAREILLHRLMAQYQRDRQNANEAVERTARKLGVSTRSVRRWLKRLKETPHIKRRKQFEHSDETLIYIRKHRAVRPAYLELKALGRVACGERAFYDAFRRLDPALQRAIRRGPTALREGQHWFSMRHRAERRNARWEIDDCLLPMWVWSEADKKLVRPWLTLIVDCFSRVIVAFAITIGDENVRPTTESVMCAIAEAILGRTQDGVFIGGVPESVGVDLGGNYQSDPLYIGLDRMDIEVDPAPARTGEHKGIVEAAFRTIEYRLISQLPGFDEQLLPKRKKAA